MQLCLLHTLFSPEKKGAWAKLQWRRGNAEKQSAYDRDYYANHRQAVLQRHRDRHAKNPGFNSNSSRKWRAKNPDRFRKSQKERYESNRLAILQKQKEGKAKNPEKFKAQARAYRVRKYRTDVNFRLTVLCRARISKAVLRGHSKSARTRELIGCTVPELKQHLEGRFQPPMGWNNHGVVWEIDHTKPCAKFNFSDPQQQRECFHFSNLQPLFKEENRLKGSK